MLERETGGLGGGGGDYGWKNKYIEREEEEGEAGGLKAIMWETLFLFGSFRVQTFIKFSFPLEECRYMV